MSTNIIFDISNINKIDNNKKNVAAIDSDIKLNNIYVEKSNEAWYIVSGEFHYSRYNREDWEAELLKMKAGGINTIATYCFWNHHEYKKGQWNFEGKYDLKYFISLCQKHNLFVILRAGPYCHGEALYGGFPPYIFYNIHKRSNNKKYLAHVRTMYEKYYEQVKDYLYPNGCIFALQLENEYTKGFSHILTLKKIAIQVGFKLPIYTVTAWSCMMDGCEVFPLYGTYPEAPWTQNKKILPDGDRFKIKPDYIDTVVGNDSNKNADSQRLSNNLKGFPLAMCELGAGVQATSHRRPVISTMDAYSLSFISIAKGVNLLGYYVYHGGFNPSERPMQETRKTFYPNNLPILNYDFQAPIGEYGYYKEKFYYLRLLHYMCRFFDKDFAKTVVVFNNDCMKNRSFSTSIRIASDNHGYCFLNTYERQNKNNELNNVNMQVVNGDSVFNLPVVNLSDSQCFVYPFNFLVEDTLVEYITAQPLLKWKDDLLHYVFIKHNEVDVKIKLEGQEEQLLDLKNNAMKIGNAVIDIINIETALNTYYTESDNTIIVNKNILYEDNGAIKAQKESIIDSSKFMLVPCNKGKRKYDKYFYKQYKKQDYQLVVDKSIFHDFDDVKLIFRAECDMAHIYCGECLVGDYININNTMEISLNRYKSSIMKDEEIIIRANAIRPKPNTYFEMEYVSDSNRIELKKAIGIKIYTL